MFLGNVRDNDGEHCLDRVFLSRSIHISVEVVRDIPLFGGVVERSEALQEMAIFLHTVFGHAFVPGLQTEVRQYLPAVGVD